MIPRLELLVIARLRANTFRTSFDSKYGISDRSYLETLEHSVTVRTLCAYTHVSPRASRRLVQRW